MKKIVLLGSVLLFGLCGACYARVDSTNYQGYRAHSQRIIQNNKYDFLLSGRDFFIGVLGRMTAIVYNEKEESHVICFDEETSRREQHVFPINSFQRLFTPFPQQIVRRKEMESDMYIASYYAYYNKEGNREYEFDRYTFVKAINKSNARYERPYKKETDLLDSLLLAFGERCVVEQYLLRNVNNNEYAICTPRLYGHIKIGLWGRGNYYYSVIEDVNTGFVDTLIWNRYRKKAQDRFWVSAEKGTILLPDGRWFYHSGDSIIRLINNDGYHKKKGNHSIRNRILFLRGKIIVQEE